MIIRDAKFLKIQLFFDMHKGYNYLYSQGLHEYYKGNNLEKIIKILKEKSI